jgi:2-polyprenyl-3-methyl-5-hydroxy-6-metoxy-1,4-benzoquinol methylase
MALVQAPRGRVLDFGGGSGVFSSVAAQLSSFTVCIDRSEAMVARGKSQAGSNPSGPPYDIHEGSGSIHWLAGDERCLAASTEPFDLILAIAVLEYVSDVEALLRSLTGLLRLDGVLLITVPNTRSTLRKAQRLLHEALGSRLVASPSKMLADQSYLTIRPHGDEVPWRSAVANAGLSVDQITQIPLGPAGPRLISRPTLLVSLRRATGGHG